MPQFTKVQSAILKVLADGNSHWREEFRNCLHDEDGDISNLKFHITNLRRKLEPVGQTIVCERRSKRTYYRWVRLLHIS